MKKSILMLVLIISANPAWGAKVVDPTCAEISTIGDGNLSRYLAVIDGYHDSEKRAGAEVNATVLVEEAAQLIKICSENKNERIQTARWGIDKLLAKETIKSAETISAVKINPLKISCKEFLGLAGDIQPVMAFWVAGYERFGKIKEGQVKQEFLTNLVFTLVDDCRSKSEESFFIQAKKWLKKNI